MNREAFEYVYIHANCMAELGLDQLANELTAMEPAVDELAHLSGEEREAMVVQQLSNMQASMALDQPAPWASPDLQAQIELNLQQMQAQDALLANLDAQAAEPLPPELLAELAAAASDAAAGEAAAGDVQSAMDGDVGGEGGAALAGSHAGQGRDLDQYLQRAYAAKAQIAARVDDGMARIDMENLDIMMFAVPEDLSPLSRPMKGKDLEKWMEVYHAGFYAVNEVVRMVRAL